MDLANLKEWLRIDGEDEDATLSSLLSASSLIIKQATGIVAADVKDNQEALNLYELVQKMLITNLYEGADKDTTPGLTSLYMQLEAYKLQTESTTAESGGTA